MQEMLLNMILPKEEQEQLKKLLTPDNIKSFAAFVKNDYQALKDQLNRIEAKLDDNRSGRGKPKLISRDAGNGGSDRGTGTDG